MDKYKSLTLSDIEEIKAEKEQKIASLIKKEIEDFKNVLESEYGAININLEDGSYEDIETEKSNE